MMNRKGPIAKGIAVLFALTGLLACPGWGEADQNLQEITAKVNRFVRGMEQKDMGLVLGIFKPGAPWAGHDLVQRIQAETEETFSLWRDIKVAIKGLKSTTRQGYMVTETTFNIQGRVVADGSAVEQNLIIRWLWEKTNQGWLVIGDNSLPGPEIPSTRPPLSSGTDGGMPVSIEVIGFGIKPGSKEETQLRGVASAGGGNYMSAQNAGELIDVLRRTVERTVQESTPPPAQPPPQPPPTPERQTNTWESLSNPAPAAQPKKDINGF